MDEKVSVRWWNHRHAIYRAIRSLQNQETFADVVLVCENKKFEAHKFVLSACSEFFEKELSEMPYRENFYLPAEIKETHFLPLLDYMYGGEAIVREEEVNPLLKAAEILCIRGLAIPFYYEENETSAEETENRTKRALITKQNRASSRKRRKCNPTKVVQNTLGSPPKGAGSVSQTCLEGEAGDHSTVGESQEVGEASEPLRGEGKTGKEESNMDVNEMLTVLINGEQSSNSAKTVQNTNTKDQERLKDPKLVCPHCQRQFHWRSNLTKHIRTHTGEKPYTCSECDYKTGYSEALKRHTRTHTGEKPYECVLCDYKCKDGSSLKLHMNKHTGESSFSCSLCAYKTRIRSAFVKHSATHALQAEVKQEEIVEVIPGSEPEHQDKIQSETIPDSQSTHQDILPMAFADFHCETSQY